MAGGGPGPVIDPDHFTKHGGRGGDGSSSNQLAAASPTSSTQPPNQKKRTENCMYLFKEISYDERGEEDCRGTQKK